MSLRIHHLRVRRDLEEGMIEVRSQLMQNGHQILKELKRGHNARSLGLGLLRAGGKNTLKTALGQRRILKRKNTSRRHQEQIAIVF